MHEKIHDLKSRIDNYREKALKEGISVKGLELDDFNQNDSEALLIRGDDFDLKTDEDTTIEEKRGGYQYMLASSAIANEHQNRLYSINSKTWKGQIKHKCHKFLQFFFPFKSDLEYLSYRYDRDVQVYFDTHRYLFMVSLIILLIYIYYIIQRILNSDFSTGVDLCKYSIPCFLFYSRVTSKEESAFSITYLTMTSMILYLLMMKYISYNKLRQNSKLYDQRTTKFSQFFFNSWDWSTKSKGCYMEKKKRLRDLYKKSNEEVSIQEKIKLRAVNEKWCRFFLRLLSFFLSLIVLCVYFGFILFSYVIRNILRSKETNKTTYTAVDIIYEIIPPILIAIFGIFFSKLLKSFVFIEKWDFETTIRNQITIRYYIGKVFGLASIYFINIYFILLGNSFNNIFNLTNEVDLVSTHGCPGLSVISSTSSASTTFTLISKNLYSECREDDVVINILFIVLAEFFIRKIYELIIFSFIYCCKKKNRARGESYKWPYRTGSAAVDTYLFFLQLIAVITYFPFITVIIPLLILAEFKFEKFKLIKMREKPLKFDIEKEDGSLLMRLFRFNLILIMVFNILFYIAKIPHLNYLQVRLFF
jgi:hypothetical protein